MSTYREIHGRSIKAVSTDPTAEVTEGEIWYNTTSDTFKSVVNNQAWASGSALGSARYDAGGAGIQTAGLCFGGRSPDIPSTALTEEYNGSGWTSGGNLNLGRQQMFAFGSQTAAVGASGYKDSGSPGQRAECEEYDGTSWSEVTNCPITSFAGAGFGVLTAGVACGGRTPSPTNATAEYDGTNWTSGGNMTASLQQLAGSGTLTAGVTFGGNDGTAIVNTIQEYDGTSWSDAGDLPAARSLAGTSGIQTAAIIFGGNSPSVVNTTLNYDGTSISSNPATLATARYGMSFPSGAPASTNTEAFAAGGYSTATVGITEEYNSSANVITASAYAALPNLNNAREAEGFGSKNGTTTAAYVGNGGTSSPGYSNYTEEFDGSSWTAGGSLPGSWRHSGGTGIQTAGLCVGGFNGPSDLNGVYHYNGSSWTSGGNYPVAQYAVSVAGTQTAAIGSGGGSDTTPANTYNGSSWTSAGTMSVGRSWFGSAGTTTASLAIGGANATTGQCEEYNGSSWTSGGSLVTGRTSSTTCSFGTQTAAGQSGANQPTNPSPGKINFLQTYDGTSWITGANMATSRNNGSGSGTTSSHLVAAGYGPGSTYQNTAEEFTTGSSALNVKTLTQS